MKTYDAVCPACGYRNRRMYLEETGGWMECENCGRLHRIPQFARRVLFRGQDPKETVRPSGDE